MRTIKLNVLVTSKTVLGTKFAEKSEEDYKNLIGDIYSDTKLLSVDFGVNPNSFIEFCKAVKTFKKVFFRINTNSIFS